jgi:hypothetical protein
MISGLAVFLLDCMDVSRHRESRARMTKPRLHGFEIGAASMEKTCRRGVPPSMTRRTPADPGFPHQLAHVYGGAGVRLGTTLCSDLQTLEPKLAPWKEGDEPARARFRYQFEPLHRLYTSRRWCALREEVLPRDCYTCTACGLIDNVLATSSAITSDRTRVTSKPSGQAHSDALPRLPFDLQAGAGAAGRLWMMLAAKCARMQMLVPREIV